MQTNGAPIIVLKKIAKFYGKTVGVRNLSFEVHRGEVFGFLGPNGAGKTTTIRLLLDLLRPTSGHISVFGKAIADDSAAIRRRCGYLPGNFAAYGNMTGVEFLQFIARLRQVTPKSRHELLERLHLSEKDLAQKIKHLSHGTRQKLGVVQAFFHEPELLILDEPSTGLDPLMQEAFYELIRDSQKRGQTIFFSSHNLPEVEKVCDRVAIIRAGELVALETLEELKQKKYRRLIFTLQQPVAELALPGARLQHRDGLRFEFLVRGDLRPLLHRLSALPIAELALPEPDLEEIFLTFYQNQSHA